MSSQAKVDGSTAQLDTDMEDPPHPTPPKRQKASSFSNTNIIKILVFALCIFIGGGVGIAGYSAFASRDIQQQNAVAIIGEGPDPDNQGKAGKAPPPVCGSTVQCGQIFTGEELELTEDLYCPQTTNGDCAITLDGEDAVLDCNKYSISSYGICIRNGASAINCHVMFNVENGILIVNEATSTSKMKISNTERESSSETSIEIANVKSNHNGRDGMRFVGNGENVKLEVQVKDSETSNNDDGISIFIDAAADVELDGIISRYNQKRGLTLYDVYGNVNMKVKGDVNLYNYKNGLVGIIVFGAAVVVERRGALNSCGNDVDIENFGGATFSGNGYTCDSTSPNLSNIITCDPCPNCPQ
eukprot:scaffold1584_cov76-Skeletonema_dohrnii-CCMP3373.AAC.2